MMKNRNSLKTEKNRFCRKQHARKGRLQLSLFAITMTIIFASCFWGMNARANNRKTDDYKYFTVVKVQAGDTLYDIANKYYDENHYDSMEDYIKEITYCNHLYDINSINAGQNLMIPYYSLEYRS